jgi:hypothetical protein
MLPGEKLSLLMAHPGLIGDFLYGDEDEEGIPSAKGGFFWHLFESLLGRTEPDSEPAVYEPDEEGWAEIDLDKCWQRLDWLLAATAWKRSGWRVGVSARAL